VTGRDDEPVQSGRPMSGAVSGETGRPLMLTSVNETSSDYGSDVRAREHS